MIAVIDYRAGNAPSVGYALERLGLEHRLAATAADLDGCDHLVLPGVGAARATLDSLHESGLVEPIAQKVLDEAIPFLGICIGLQVLFDHSEEGDVDPEELYRKTGGNPFFVVEALAAGADTIPETVRDAVFARAAHLSPTARTVLEAAAILTPPAELWLLESLSGEEFGALTSASRRACSFTSREAQRSVTSSHGSPWRTQLLPCARSSCTARLLPH